MCARRVKIRLVPKPIITAHRAAPRAVFLDRDGVLTRSIVRDGKPYAPASPAELEIEEDAPAALAALKRLGFLLLVVTNQPDVARGALPPAALEEMHAALRAALPLDGIYVCPHDDGDNCRCRKPRPGMLEDAAREHGIDLARSVMVGDRWRDVDAGHHAGCATVLIDQIGRASCRERV